MQGAVGKKIRANFFFSYPPPPPGVPPEKKAVRRYQEFFFLPPELVVEKRSAVVQVPGGEGFRAYINAGIHALHRICAPYEVIP